MSHFENKGRLVSLQVVARHLAKLLNMEVKFLNDCIGDKIKNQIKSAKPGQIFLLENLRFHSQEKANDENFGYQLAKLGDCYVNEAFSVSHRAHASVVGIPRYLPSYAGLLFEEEINTLARVLKNPSHPFVVAIGGVKIETKSKLIANIVKTADHILVGSKIGEKILVYKNQLMRHQIQEKNPALDAIDLTSSKIHLPVDGVLALKDLSEGYLRTAAIGSMRQEEDIYDIGPETVKFFVEIVKEAKTIFFNGTMGLFEKQEFSLGTKMILEAISNNNSAYRVAGGGETLEAIRRYKATKSFDFLSTGGGAMLEFLAGNTLPGIAALEALPVPVPLRKKNN